MEESGCAPGPSSEPPMVLIPAEIKVEPPLEIGPEQIETVAMPAAPPPLQSRPTLEEIRPFACDLGCKSKFFTHADLAKHKERCSAVPACSVCGQVYRSRRALRQHMDIVHSEIQPFECRVTPGCPARFPKMILQRKHEIICGNGALPRESPEKRCPTCGKLFRTVLKRDAHRPMCGLTTTCTLCGKKTGTVKSMLYHMNKHKGLKPYQCRSCGKGFHSRGSRNGHETTCRKKVPEETVPADPGNPPCMNCGKTFANHDHLVRHFKLCQFEKPKPSNSGVSEPPEPIQEYSCQACGQQFPSTGALSVHQLTCSLMRICTICNKEFACRVTLTYHMNWHYGILPYECRETPGCRIRFSSTRKRNEHEKACAFKNQQQQQQTATTSDTPVVVVKTEQEDGKASGSSSKKAEFRCETCDKAFSTIQQRKKHQIRCGLTTTCAICGKTLANVTAMVFHMNMHKGIKPYECREGTGCGFRFSNPGSRNTHEVNCKKNNKKCKKSVDTVDANVSAASTVIDVKPAIDHDQNMVEYPAVTTESPVTQEPPLIIKQEPDPEAGAVESVTVKQCSGCNKNFASDAFLKMHQLNCTARKDCHICGKTFGNRTSLKFHLNVHNGVTPLTCRKMPGCRARFFDSTSRYYHESYCGQYGPDAKPALSYKCSGCSQEFASAIILSQHQVRCNVSTDCVYCGLTLSSMTSLQYHINKHKGITPYKCPYCPRKYSNPSARNFHERRCNAGKNKATKGSTNPESLTCQRCGKKHGTIRQLTRHQQYCVPANTCTKCGKTFQSACSFRAHMNRHNGIKPYPCRESPLCEARFYAAGMRNTHERQCAFKGAGNAELPGQLKCASCDKVFAKAVHLQSHELLCTGRVDPEKEEEEEETQRDQVEESVEETAKKEIQEAAEEMVSLSCVGCGVTFPSKDLLLKHQHRCGTKQKCPICKQKVSVNSFNYHMNKHSGVKPYRCRVRDGCPAEYHDANMRSRHERLCGVPPTENREEEVTEKCLRCGKDLDRRTMVHVCEGLLDEAEDAESGGRLKVIKWSCTKGIGMVGVKEEVVEQKVEEKNESEKAKVEKEEGKAPPVDGDLTFTCEACGKEFSSSEARNKHVSSCSKALPYQCRLSADCPERFVNAEFRRNHEVICGKSRRLGGKSELVACRHCGKVCNGKQLLRVHKELCGPDAMLSGQLKCTVCPEVYDSVDKLQEHLDDHNRDKLLKCRALANCTETFKQKRTRIDHELECTAAGQSICSMCYKLLPNPEALVEHEESCQANEFICRLCDKTYSNIANLRKHILDHESPGQQYRWWEKPTPNTVMPNRERYGCKDCGQEFSTQEELEKHPRFCQKKFRCSQCPATFSMECSLSYHMNTHTGLKPFACRKEGCTKSFAFPFHRKCHEDVCGTDKEAEHLKKVEQATSYAAKVFSCPHCPETFKAVNELKYHVNEHKATTMYPCRQSEDCKETFTTRGFRLKHEAVCGKSVVAPKEPPKVELIACRDCGKVFSNLQYLRIHKTKCTGSPNGPPANLKCTMCKVISPDVDALQAHLDEHNREKPFQCRVSKGCSESYINERQRGNHEFVCNADGQIICQRCYKLCSCLETLKTHEKTCRGTEFPCRLCEVVLRSRNSQLVHYLKHDKDTGQSKELHACPSCDQKFNKKANFFAHLKEHNIDPSDLQIKCEICAATFKSPKSMKVHMNCHKGIKSYKCRYQGCEEAFFQSGAREIHEQNCTKLSLTCDICELKLDCVRDYQLHIRSHDAVGIVEEDF